MPFFTAHPERIDVLRAEAKLWLGTPFRANSGARGRDGGVDCIRLAQKLEQAAGAVPPVRFPRYAIDAGSHVARSPLAEYLRGRGEQPDSAAVARFLQPRRPDRPVRAGDVLVCRFARVPYHLAVVLTDEGDLIHVLYGREVDRATLRDRTFARAVQIVFRPVLPDVQDTLPLMDVAQKSTHLHLHLENA